MTAIIDDFAAIRSAVDGAARSGDEVVAVQKTSRIPETPIAPLSREYDRLCDEADKEASRDDTEASWERGQVLYGQAGQVADKIVSLPAVSIGDVRVQLDLLFGFLTHGRDPDTAIMFELYYSISAAVRDLDAREAQR